MTPADFDDRMKKTQKGAYHMGWENQVICKIKGNAQAAYGVGALFFG